MTQQGLEIEKNRRQWVLAHGVGLHSVRPAVRVVIEETMGIRTLFFPGAVFWVQLYAEGFQLGGKDTVFSNFPIFRKFPNLKNYDDIIKDISMSMRNAFHYKDLANFESIVRELCKERSHGT